MEHQKLTIVARKKIALVAHDNKIGAKEEV
jgi:hypothetical protein